MKNKLLAEIKSCTKCKLHLPFDPRPILQFSKKSKIMIVGQAPGIRVHDTGIPWNDPSGDRLREWMKIDKNEFYNTQKIAIVPMGFCYPGKGLSGDLPPRPECAETWMQKVLSELNHIELILLIGQYSQKYFLNDLRQKNLTETVKNWENYLPKYLVLPHPSPRNNIWLKKNPWFEKRLVPEMRKRINEALTP